MPETNRTLEYMKLYRCTVELSNVQPNLDAAESVSLIVRVDGINQAFVQLERADLLDYEFDLLREFVAVVKARLDEAALTCEQVLDAAVRRIA